MTLGIYPPPTLNNGTNGLDGSTWRNGSGAPSNGLGSNGDYYLDNATGDVYYKSAGTYSVILNIDGADGAPGAATIITKDEGGVIDSAATALNFVGAGVTATDAGSHVTTVTIPGAGASAAIITQDEGSVIDTGATTLNFVGTGVSVVDAGGGVTQITIAGISSGADSAAAIRMSYLLFGAF